MNLQTTHVQSVSHPTNNNRQLTHDNLYDIIVPEDAHPSTMILDAMMAIDNRIHPPTF